MPPRVQNSTLSPGSLIHACETLSVYRVTSPHGLSVVPV